MLSKYVPAERLQIELLNKWRNEGKYEGDPFAPSAYGFDYLFATAMAGQPLAWMEASNLPEEAFSVSGLLSGYREISAEFHSGMIFPIGDEPSGRSWTGFQSILSDKCGYMLVYREDSDDSESLVRTWLPEGLQVSFEPVLGSGEAFSAKTGADGSVRFALPSHNSFAMYRYRIMRSLGRR